MEQGNQMKNQTEKELLSNNKESTNSKRKCPSIISHASSLSNSLEHSFKSNQDFIPLLEIFSDNKIDFVKEPDHEHLIIFNNDKTVTKYCSFREAKIYSEIFNKSNSKYQQENEILQQLVPKIIGVETRLDQPYIILENIESEFKNNYSYLILKIGNKSFASIDEEITKNTLNEIDLSTTSVNYGFRIISYGINKRNGILEIAITRNPKHFSRVNYRNISPLLKLFLSTQNKNNKNSEVNIVALDYFVDFLLKLLIFFKEKNSRIFINFDIFFGYSIEDNKFVAKILDLDKVYDISELDFKIKWDENYVNGIINLFKIFKNLNRETNFLKAAQLAGGHVNNFKFNEDGTIEKKTKRTEALFIKTILESNSLFKYFNENEALKRFIPKYYAVYEKEGMPCLKMENLTF